MKTKLFVLLCTFILSTFLMSCSRYVSQVIFPPSDEMFMTSGDGDIQKPYTPVGQLIYIRKGFRLPLPIFGMIPFKDIDPDYELKTEIPNRIKQMGGDGIINMAITFNPAKPRYYFLGAAATGGRITVYGTVIKR